MRPDQMTFSEKWRIGETVTVHTSGRSEGGGWWVKWCWIVLVTKANTSCFCWRQVSLTISSVSNQLTCFGFFGQGRC